MIRNPKRQHVFLASAEQFKIFDPLIYIYFNNLIKSFFLSVVVEPYVLFSRYVLVQLVDCFFYSANLLQYSDKIFYVDNKEKRANTGLGSFAESPHQKKHPRHRAVKM